MNINEFKVRVPWGQIEIKAWGKQEDTPVLVIHGLMDNAGSFDRLLPLLPITFYYLCIDLPGHGKSSHFPPHMPIHSENFLYVLKLLAEYFKRGKYILMGHSFGGQIAITFAQLYPEHVTKLIMLDAIYFYTTPAKDFKDILVSEIARFVAFEEKMKNRKNENAQIYTYEEALNRLKSGRGFATSYLLSKEAAEALLQRMLVSVGNEGYTFSMDHRLKHIFHPRRDIDYALVLEILRRFPIQCPTLFILAKQSKYQLKMFKPVLNLLEKQNNILVTYVDNHHEVHNESPEVVVPLISKFLIKNKSKL